MNKTELVNSVAEAAELSKKTQLKQLRLYLNQFKLLLQMVKKFN